MRRRALISGVLAALTAPFLPAAQAEEEAPQAYQVWSDEKDDWVDLPEPLPVSELRRRADVDWAVVDLHPERGDPE